MKKLISFCKEHMFRIVVIILLVGILGNTIYLQFSLLQVKQKAEMALAGTYVIARYLNIIPFSQPSGKLMADKDIESRRCPVCWDGVRNQARSSCPACNGFGVITNDPNIDRVLI